MAPNHGDGSSVPVKYTVDLCPIKSRYDTNMHVGLSNRLSQKQAFYQGLFV